MSEVHASRNKWLHRLGWLIAIWAASVTALALFAYGIRLLMSAVGMTV